MQTGSETYCKDYLKRSPEFDWFIERYYGKGHVDYLKNLAKNNRFGDLNSALNKIWFELPDHIFNIRENPTGWLTFLDFVEN